MSFANTVLSERQLARGQSLGESGLGPGFTVTVSPEGARADWGHSVRTEDWERQAQSWDYISLKVFIFAVYLGFCVGYI